MTTSASGLHWRKSRRSSDSGGNCVEIARTLSGTTGIRDSKLGETGTPLWIATSDWTAFHRGLTTGAFDPR